MRGGLLRVRELKASPATDHVWAVQRHDPPTAPQLPAAIYRSRTVACTSAVSFLEAQSVGRRAEDVGTATCLLGAASSAVQVVQVMEDGWHAALSARLLGGLTRRKFRRLLH